MRLLLAFPSNDLYDYLGGAGIEYVEDAFRVLFEYIKDNATYNRPHDLTTLRSYTQRLLAYIQEPEPEDILEYIQELVDVIEYYIYHDIAGTINSITNAMVDIETVDVSSTGIWIVVRSIVPKGDNT